MNDIIPSKKYFVYLTTNLIDGKVYAGVHHGFENDNYLGSGIHLKNAINKHSKVNFIREILYFCESKEHALKLENLLVTHEWISSPMSYNLTIGGNCYLGERSLSTKEKMSKAQKGKRRKHTEETKVKISESKKGEKHYFYGKKHTEEYKLHMSQKLKGRFIGNKNPFYGKTHTEEIKEKISNALKGEKNPFYGKTHTEETKEKLRKLSTGKNHTKETCLKISKIHKGKKRSEETKEKMSKIQKELSKLRNTSGKNNNFYGKKHTEETRRKLSESHKGHIMTEETKAKIRETKRLKKLQQVFSENILLHL